MRVWRLEPLTDDDVAAVVRRALADPDRGLAGPLGPDGGVASTDDAFDHLISLAGGDARAALNVLEGATALAESEEIRDADGRVSPRLEDVEAAAQQRVLAYDRAGDGHYDTVCAFIKSLRGNDPDAALYWLAAMIAAGEDPKFIARRLIISASEDVGNADPRALQVAVAAGQALDWIGLPEAQYALAQATTYIATAPKSNRSGRPTGPRCRTSRPAAPLPVPLHLRNAAHRRMKQHGIGVGYRYPHDFEGADVDQQYLPDALAAAATTCRPTRATRPRSPRAWPPAPRPGPGEGRTDAALEDSRPGGDPALRRAIMKTRETNRKKLAETEKRDAGA